MANTAKRIARKWRTSRRGEKDARMFMLLLDLPGLQLRPSQCVSQVCSIVTPKWRTSHSSVGCRLWRDFDHDLVLTGRSKVAQLGRPSVSQQK